MLLTHVFPTYNRPTTLKSKLERLRRQSLPMSKWEVIVVGDHCEDNTEAMMADLIPTLPYKCRFLETRDHTDLKGGNYGIAAAKNKGILAADGDVIVLGSDDLIPNYECFEEFLRACKRGTVAIGYDSSHDPSIRFAKGGKPDWQDFFNVAVWKQDLLDAGLCDEQLANYGFDDLDLGLRLWLKPPLGLGCDFVYTPGARVEVTNPEYETNPQSRDLKYKQEAMNRVIMRRKHPHYPHYLIGDFTMEGRGEPHKLDA